MLCAFLWLYLCCFFVCLFLCVSMSGKKKKAASPACLLLQPTVLFDALGSYIAVTCGSLSGNFYLSRLLESNQSQSKCILVSSKWYSPPEFEALAGKKARKWRQSLFHLGKPLSSYLITRSLASQGSSHSNSAETHVSGLSCSAPVGGHVFSQPCTAGGSRSSVRLVDACTDCDLSSNLSSSLLVDTALSFVKAFRLKGDADSLRMVVRERFSPKEIEKAKLNLWNFCKSDLEANGLQFHARRDSDKRSQLMADLSDLLKFFDVLDSVDQVPPIHCEASDLLRLPPFSLDPVAEQVQGVSQSLSSLSDMVDRFDKKLSSFLDSSSSTSVQSSYASVASSTALTNHVPSSTMSAQKNITPHSLSPDGRELNVILFGLPDEGSIVDSKQVVDEMLEFLAGKQIHIKDMFRLGRFRKPQPSALPPRPILVKLSTAWDRKLVLSRRVKLKEFHIKRLFLREDVAPDHRLRRRPSALPSDKATISSSGAIPSRSVAASHSPLLQHSGASGDPKLHPSLLPTPLSRSVSPVASSRSVSPSASTASSSSSSSTIIQVSDGPHDDAT